MRYGTASKAPSASRIGLDFIKEIALIEQLTLLARVCQS